MNVESIQTQNEIRKRDPTICTRSATESAWREQCSDNTICSFVLFFPITSSLNVSCMIFCGSQEECMIYFDINIYQAGVCLK